MLVFQIRNRRLCQVNGGQGRVHQIYRIIFGFSGALDLVELWHTFPIQLGEGRVLAIKSVK